MSHLHEIIQAEIALRGIMPFQRFMELALYCPEYGYYEKESDTVGKAGDFQTSVSVGPLFGSLLAFQFAEWLEVWPGERVQIVEAGAHDGKLAKDILDWLRTNRAQLFSRLEYVIIEPSARRRSWQQKRLREFANQVRWQDQFLEAAEPQFTGVIFANELLDAFPVRRIGWDASVQHWYEWGVTWTDGKFAWAKRPGTVEAPELMDLPTELLAVLPGDFTTEICPQAEQWWATAVKSLRRGYALTLDYGFQTEDFFAPQRAQGTLRAYRQHCGAAEILSDPGTQDITAHVNFSQIQRAGELAGAKTLEYATQGELLLEIAKQFWPAASEAGQWTARQNRELQTLVHPEHFGRAFQVLVQRRVFTDKSVGRIT